MFLRLAAVTVTALLAIACSEPPHKEMHQAQGAIEAARAAGADTFAPDELRDAEQALEESETAVTQRDYRLALRYALDARERAHEAARAAANRKADARGDAERALAAAEGAAGAARRGLTAAQASRVRPRDIAPLQQALSEADDALQKARAAMEEERYLDVPAMLEGIEARLDAAIKEIEARPPARPARRRP
jgi:hypothetical protein